MITTCSLKLVMHEKALPLSVAGPSRKAFPKFKGFVWLNHLRSLPPSAFDLFKGVLSIPLKQARLCAERLNLIYDTDLTTPLCSEFFYVVAPFFIYNN